MVRWGMVIDLKRCFSCSACMIACKQEHFLPPGVFWSRLLIGETGEHQAQTSGRIQYFVTIARRLPASMFAPVEPAHREKMVS